MTCLAEATAPVFHNQMKVLLNDEVMTGDTCYFTIGEFDTRSFYLGRRGEL
ncbi:MAG: hypothetical protein K9K37_03435 [Desulfocapsa sp.]|nr:hypothetical protein [Desulfocapsa sp.]